MKFYKRFPGDIQIKTGGLSLAEFGAYDRLLDHYYAMEAPIEAAEIYSITRAQGKTDRDAVDKVLRRYFTIDEGGNYVQERAAEMIAEAQPKIAAAKANGKLGGRPKGSAKKPTGFIPETQGESQDANLAQGSQSQNKKELSKPSASHPLSGEFDEFWLSWPKSERKQDKAKCADHWKRQQLCLIVDTIVDDVRLKRGTQKWQEGFVETPLVYLRGRRWEDGVEPEAPKAAVATVAATESVVDYAARIAREAKAAEQSPEERARASAAIAEIRRKHFCGPRESLQ
jgi:uncharacterized protein YdaU (DUF1376 family)